MMTLGDLRAFDRSAAYNRDCESRFCCPLCGVGKTIDATHRSVSVSPKGLWACHRCGQNGLLAEWQKDVRAAAHQSVINAVNSGEWKKRLESAVPLVGSPGEAYLNKRGIDTALAQKAGVKFTSDWFGRPAVLFTHYDMSGNLASAFGRYIDGRSDPAGRDAGKKSNGFFAAASDWKQSQTVALVEAAIDALSLTMVGCPAVAFGGTAMPKWFPSEMCGRHVLIASDADEAGDRAAAQWEKMLRDAGVSTQRLRPAERFKDWNEMLTNEPDAIRSQLIADTNSPLSRVMNAAELLGRELPPLQWTVEGLLPVGATLLAGRPKSGKSWLVFATALAVATGGKALGKLDVTAGEVLYMALEDGPRRLQDRLRTLLGEEPCPSRLHLVTEWPGSHEGGTKFLSQWLTAHPNTRLVIIDTLARVRPPRRYKGDPYADDYEAVSAWKTVADMFGICLVIVTHDRKAGADDPFDTVSGTLGITGAADAVAVLQRKRGSASGLLHVTGRDIEERELALTLSIQAGGWSLVGNAEEVCRSSEEEQVIAVLRDAGPLCPKELAEAMDIREPAARQRLSRMYRRGAVTKEGAKYGAVTPVTPVTIPTEPVETVTLAPENVTGARAASLRETPTDADECDSVTGVTPVLTIPVVWDKGLARPFQPSPWASDL